ITNTITGTTEVTGIKTWDDNNNQDGIRPASIIVRLLQNNNEIDSIVVNADENGNWTYSFDNLNKYDSDGELYEYTVTEDAVSDYTTTFDGYNITNTHTPETKEITINKTWSDYNDADGTRPDSVTVHLYKTVNDVITEVGNGYEVKASENWTLTIPNLPVYENGVEIEYSITEDEVEGYTTDINEFAITNTYTTSASVSGTKTWVDSNDLYNTRPESIIITLLKDGVEYGSQEVSADANGDWTYSFINLEKYNEDGSEIKYTIKEVAVDGYTSVVDGYDITNTLVTGNLTIKKISNGTETPDDAIFTIYDSEGNAITEIKYSEFTKGSFTLENIAVGTYTVVESNADMDGYDLEVIVSSSDVTIENDSESTITFTNTYSQIQTEEGNDTDDSSSEEEVVSENETGIQTGDDSNVLGYSILAIAALAFIAIFRKRRYE
ncbi:MAG: Cna B-type domain-containing protein, partial [Erysipelotrichaceae bacterium]|nr:Cna B-type domain-containing protein [Erysipelotrichaceae bacterium]